MRTGAEYREALRDGRRVWVMGEGLVEDVTTHPGDPRDGRGICRLVRSAFRPGLGRIRFLRRPMPTANGDPGPMSCRGAPTTSAGWAGSFPQTTFLSAGNITHTPAYGHLIALGVLTAVQERNVSPEQIANASRYREHDRPHRAVSDLLRRRPDDRRTACARTRASAPP